MKIENWPDKVRRLCGRLGIEHPIIQAPMAGGPSTPKLVAAVSNAGGLGSLGLGYLAPGDIDAEIKKTRALTDRPFAANLFVPSPEARGGISDNVLKRLNEYSGELGVDGPVVPPEPSGFTFEDQFGVVLDNNVPVFSFTFGLPEERYIKELLHRNIAVIGTATCVGEGLLLERAGCNAVTAQGSEAGGHRGTFSSTIGTPMIGGMSLIPQLADSLGIPVIASGGIMDGRAIVAALALGASGVQMGTAFLGCEEARLAGPWLDALLRSSDTSTVLTKTFSGKYARGINNRFIEEMTGLEDEVPEYPIQNTLTRPLRSVAKSQSNPDFMSLWAGQSSPLTKRSTAGELFDRLLREIREVIVRINEEI